MGVKFDPLLGQLRTTDTAGTGSGTVTSIDVQGGTTGLTTSGGPVTVSGVITLGGTLTVANGGTGSATQNFVDLSTTQSSIAGAKTFTSAFAVNNTVILTSASGVLTLGATGVLTFAKSTTGASTISSISGTLTQASTNGAAVLSLLPTYNQTGTSDGRDFLINRIETGVGSGTQLFLDFQVSGTSRFNVTDMGQLNIATQGGTAFNVVNGGAAGAAYLRLAKTSSVNGAWGASITQAWSNTSGTNVDLMINPTNTGTSTAATTNLIINRTDTSVGSGPQLFVDYQVSSTSKFKVDNTGVATVANVGTGAGALVSVDGTQTLTNKRVTARTGTTASSATPTINTDTVDVYTITALATAITSMTTNLTGTPPEGQKLLIRFKDNGSPQTIAWGASFVSSGVATLLATTVASKTHLVGLIWDNVAAKWVCQAVDATGY